jgi:hypothetical protein
MPGPTKVTGVHWRTSTVIGNQCDMIDMIIIDGKDNEAHCTATVSPQHPMRFPVEDTVWDEFNGFHWISTI